ncbi:AsnC family transcriptional regulator [Gordonia alkanivorans CGMCC 6845]|jgi:DNA-binding Lrp family transcriptional regulator|uniref:AsnC family transcriptional regulator n=1 Tax=Gordonia alkanivorans CGMCC 6845 TaxID=1423140 RepID=W9DII4_9ACTN|nr:AsnC family transcriptional regulator [Gordonia alkanivorans CGMCC 6845]
MGVCGTEVGIVPSEHRADRIDAKILTALADDPRATVMAVAERTGLSRNTVQARLSKLDAAGALRSFERRVDPAVLGYPLQAYVLTNVTQRKLDQVGAALEAIPEVLQVHGLTGVADLLVHVAAKDADDLYRIAGDILDIKGVKRTTTALVMREMVDFRVRPLLDALAE